MEKCLSHQLPDQCRKLVVEMTSSDEMFEVLKTLIKKKPLRKRNVAAENRKIRKWVREENIMFAELLLDTESNFDVILRNVHLKNGK